MSQNINKKVWDEKFDSVFEMVFDHSLVGMAILNGEGQFIRVNSKACDIWGYDETDLIKKKWQDITHPDDVKPSLKYIKLKEIEPIEHSGEIVKRYLTGLGKTITCRITTTALKNQQGQIEYFVTEIQDITNKIEAIQSIKEGIALIKNIGNRS